MNSRSRSPPKGGRGRGDADSPTRSLFGVNFPLGIDREKITEEEINRFLKETSVKSLEQIALETGILSGQTANGGNMVCGAEKITLREIEEFMKGISAN